MGTGDGEGGEAMRSILGRGWRLWEGLCDFRNRIKAEAQAREEMVLPFTWVLIEEPLGCNIL